MIDNFGQQDGFETGGLASGKFQQCFNYKAFLCLLYPFDLYINVTFCDSGFCCKVDGNHIFLGYYAASRGNP